MLSQSSDSANVESHSSDFRDLDAIAEQGELAKQINDLLKYVGKNNDELEPLSTELMAILRFATNPRFGLKDMREMALSIALSYEEEFSGPVAHMQLLLGDVNFEGVKVEEVAFENYTDS